MTNMAKRKRLSQRLLEVVPSLLQHSRTKRLMVIAPTIYASLSDLQGSVQVNGKPLESRTSADLYAIYNALLHDLYEIKDPLGPLELLLNKIDAATDLDSGPSQTDRQTDCGTSVAASPGGQPAASE